MSYCIYLLKDPFIENKGYIGYTKNHLLRYKGHIKDKTNSKKVKWINELKEQNSLPLMIILEKEIENIEDALNKEIEYIKKYKENGYIY